MISGSTKMGLIKTNTYVSQKEINAVIWCACDMFRGAIDSEE